MYSLKLLFKCEPSFQCKSVTKRDRVDDYLKIKKTLFVS